jgi:AMP phosphorylase
MSMKLKVKVLDLDADKSIVVLNTENSLKLKIPTNTRVCIEKTKEIKEICITNISNNLIDSEHIGVFQNIANKLCLKTDDEINISVMPYPKSVEYIIKKIRNKALNEKEIYDIIKDIFEDKLSDAEISGFMTATYIHDLDLNETIYFSKALTNVGKKLNFNKNIVLDKHSIGGINGRVSMIVVPIISLLGFTIPKTASRSISSAAGTADAMEVLAKVSFSLEEFKEIVEKTNGIVAWNGKLDLSPVDDKLIKVRHDLGLDPEGVVIASVLSKKVSAGATHVLIDIPVGREVKVHTKEDGNRWAKKFIEVGKALNLKIKVVLTNAETPCGKSFGAALEAKEVLEILECKYFNSLAEKSCELAGELLELAGFCKDGDGYDIAKKEILNGRALEKFKEIISFQKGNIFNSKDVILAKYKKTINSVDKGIIADMDVSILTQIARIAGAPINKTSGLLVLKDIGEKIEELDIPIFEIYSDSLEKLEDAYNYSQDNIKSIVQYQKIIINEVE